MTLADTQADCSCRSGRHYVGPMGGRYCITDGGGKSRITRDATFASVGLDLRGVESHCSEVS
jgi:hypothetical protein